MISHKATLPAARFDPARVISWAAAALVFILAALAFILSYSSLRHVAAQNGVGERLSYVWPLLLDFAMVVFSLAILRANLRGEPARYPWALTIAFALLATVANVLDAAPLGIPPVWIAGAVKALAPIALVLAFELLMTMIRAEVKRSAAAATLEELGHQVDEARAQLDQVRAEASTERQALAVEMSQAREAVAAELAALQAQREALKRERVESRPARPSKPAKKQPAAQVTQPTAAEFNRAAALKGEGLSWPEVAAQLGRSVTTVKRWAAQAEPVRSANGHGGVTL